MDAAVTTLAGHPADTLDTTDRCAWRERPRGSDPPTGRRQQASSPDCNARPPAELGGSLTDTVARATLGTTREAKRRITDAEDATAHRPRRQPLPPGCRPPPPPRRRAHRPMRIPRSRGSARCLGGSIRRTGTGRSVSCRTGRQVAAQRTTPPPTLLVFAGHEPVLPADRAHRRRFSWSHGN